MAMCLIKTEERLMGSDPDNIELTHRSGNRSKGENDLDEWHDKSVLTVESK